MHYIEEFYSSSIQDNTGIIFVSCFHINVGQKCIHILFRIII